MQEIFVIGSRRMPLVCIAAVSQSNYAFYALAVIWIIQLCGNQDWPLSRYSMPEYPGQVQHQ